MLTKDMIFRETAGVVFNQGYMHTRLEDVAARIGVTRPYLYYHFTNKDDLIMQLVEWAETEYYQRFTQNAARAKDPLTAVLLLLDQFTRLMRENQWRAGCLIGILSQEVSGNNDDFRKRLNRSLENATASIAALLDSYKSKSQLSADFDSQRAAEVVMSILQGAMLLARSLRQRRPMDNARLLITSYFNAFQNSPTGNTEEREFNEPAQGNA